MAGDGRNMMPVPTNALSNVKKAFVVPASPAFVARELFRCPRSGRLEPCCSSRSSTSRGSSTSVSESSSGSNKSSPAKPPYRSRKETKFPVTGAVTLWNRRFCLCRNSRLMPPGASAWPAVKGVRSVAISKLVARDLSRLEIPANVADRWCIFPLALTLKRSRWTSPPSSLSDDSCCEGSRECDLLRSSTTA